MLVVGEDSVPEVGVAVAKNATVTVLPSAEHPEFLTVHDAMLQIADAFALLKGDGGDAYDWRLVKASTNSPFTAVGELVVLGGAPAGILASAELSAVEAHQALADILSGEESQMDFDAVVARRLLTRNLNGVGVTRIALDGFPDIVIAPQNASIALDAVKAPKATKTPRRVRGSIEGTLVDAGQYRKHPALKLKERVRGRIVWCRIPEELEEQFASETSLKDIWRHARVRLRGWIEYSPAGNISSMTAERINHIHARAVAESEIVDPHLTGGLDAITYLDRLRDGDLG